MPLVEEFRKYLAGQIGSVAAPALRQHLRDREFRLVSFTEHGGRWVRDVYHPSLGFFRSTGRDEREALLGILRQIWLVESLGDVQEAGAKSAE